MITECRSIKGGSKRSSSSKPRNFYKATKSSLTAPWNRSHIPTPASQLLWQTEGNSSETLRSLHSASEFCRTMMWSLCLHCQVCLHSNVQCYPCFQANGDKQLSSRRQSRAWLWQHTPRSSYSSHKSSGSILRWSILRGLFGYWHLMKILDGNFCRLWKGPVSSVAKFGPSKLFAWFRNSLRNCDGGLLWSTWWMMVDDSWCKGWLFGQSRSPTR